MSTLIEELKTQISVEVDFLDEVMSPIITSQLGDPQQRETIIETIAATAIAGKMSIGQAMFAIERSYGNSEID